MLQFAQVNRIELCLIAKQLVTWPHLLCVLAFVKLRAWYILFILFVYKKDSTKSAEAKKSSQESSNKPESASSSKGDKSESKGDKSESKGDKSESKGDKSSTKTNKQEDEVKKRKKSPVPSSSKG